MTRSAPTDTRTRLLDAAERHFAERGFDGASLRQITSDARANLAAAHYHFGSKEDLFVAVLARRIEPISRERLDRLDQVESDAAGEPVPLEAVLAAFVGPPLRAGASASGGRECLLRLFGRMQSEPEALWKRIVDGPLRETRKRFAAALRRALPRLTDEELAWRMHFVIGTMTGVAADQHRLRLLSNGRCDPSDIDGTIRQLVPFLAGGLRAAKAPSRSSATAAGRRQR